MDKITELKQLVGEDVAGEILATSKQLTHRAKRLGLKHKEAGMPQQDFAEFMAAYQAFKALNAGNAGEVAEFDDEVLYDDPVVEPVVEEVKEVTLEEVVTKAVKSAFAEMRAETEAGEKTKELATLKATNAQLLKTVKELSDRVAALEQPVAPQNTAGYRITDNPQETAKTLGASVSGAVEVLDMLGGFN